MHLGDGFLPNQVEDVVAASTRDGFRARLNTGSMSAACWNTFAAPTIPVIWAVAAAAF